MTSENLHNSRILIIDDEELHGELLAGILISHGYREVRPIKDPRKAVQVFEEFRPDLIILDWLMPGLTGADVLAQLRAIIPAESYLPILVVTGAPDIGVRRSALATGATDFLSKPYDASEIVLRVDNLARTRMLLRRVEENENRMRALFEQVTDAIVIGDDDGRFLDVNPAACELFGYSREELLERSIWDVLIPDRVPAGQKEWQVLLARGRRHGECGMRRKDGSEADVECRSVSNFLPGLHLSVMREITQRKRMEAQLRASVKEIRDLQSALDEHAIVAITDPQGRITYVNDKFCAISKYSREELLGNGHHIISSGHHPPETLHGLWKTIRRGEVWQGEIRNRAKDGTFYWVDTTIVPFSDPQGAIRQYVVIRTDITERKRTEAALRESEARLRQILEALPAATYTCDAEGLITFFNRRAAELWGQEPALLDPAGRFSGGLALFRPSGELLPPESSGMARALRERQSVGGEEMVIERSDGRRVFTLAYSDPLLDTTGQLVGAVNVLIDISDRRTVETALRDAKVDAEKANRAKSDFLSRMSHELRTPLNAILGFAQVLEMHQLEEQQRECLCHILKAGQHLLALINEVLDISGIEAGRLTFSIEPVRISDVARESLDLVRPMADQRGLQLQLASEKVGDMWVLADRQRLKQVLLNLLANAVKYNREGGTVTLSWEMQPAERLRIAVTDTGEGIAPENLHRLFSPFDRLGAEQTAVEGNGLGLALSKRLIHALGGEIGADSEVGQGSTFWIKLPRSVNPLERLGEMTIEEGVLRSLGHGTVLYIEDNLSNLTLIEYLFAQRPGIRLLAAMQGRLGLALAREHQPDLILLDLHLPDLMGDEVLAALKSNPATREIKVVMLTADPSPAQQTRLLAAGADAYLTKPVDVPRLLRVLAGILGGRGGEKPELEEEKYVRDGNAGTENSDR